MDNAVLRSMAMWPDVPDVYGWLRLDRRGAWRVGDPASPAPVHEPIGNAALREFVGRNYAADSRGCWYFQNGPQRVFVGLAYAPYVYRLESDALVDQCGVASGPVAGAWLDEEGSLIVLAQGGRLGLLDDRDLGALAEGLESGQLRVGRDLVRVGRTSSAGLEARFGFVREPAP